MYFFFWNPFDTSTEKNENIFAEVKMNGHVNGYVNG